MSSVFHYWVAEIKTIYLLSIYWENEHKTKTTLLEYIVYTIIYCLRRRWKKKHVKRHNAHQSIRYSHKTIEPLSLEKIKGIIQQKDVIKVAGNKREFSKEKSSLSNNRGNCQFPFCYSKDYETRFEFCVLKNKNIFIDLNSTQKLS